MLHRNRYWKACQIIEFGNIWCVHYKLWKCDTWENYFGTAAAAASSGQQRETVDSFGESGTDMNHTYNLWCARAHSPPHKCHEISVRMRFTATVMKSRGNGVAKHMIWITNTKNINNNESIQCAMQTEQRFQSFRWYWVLFVVFDAMCGRRWRLCAHIFTFNRWILWENVMPTNLKIQFHPLLMLFFFSPNGNTFLGVKNHKTIAIKWLVSSVSGRLMNDRRKQKVFETNRIRMRPKCDGIMRERIFARTKSFKRQMWMRHIH